MRENNLKERLVCCGSAAGVGGGTSLPVQIPNNPVSVARARARAHAPLGFTNSQPAAVTRGPSFHEHSGLLGHLTVGRHRYSNIHKNITLCVSVCQ